MSHPYTCATCRLQRILRKTSQFSNRQRQWLSQTARARQGPPIDTLAQEPGHRFDRSKSRRQHDSEAVGRQARGRYSGNRLGPQEVLEQLNEPLGGARGSTYSVQAERDPSRYHQAIVRNQHFDPRLWDLYQRFSNAQNLKDENNHNDREAVEILRQISSDVDRAGFVHWEQFHRRCFFLMRRLCHQWGNRLTRSEASVQDIPSPIEALIAITACTSEVHDLYPSTLWNLATLAVRLRPQGGSAPSNSFSLCIRNLMAVWNLTMRVKLSPDSLVNLTPDATLDWSFLPNHITIVESLEDNAHASLIHVLNLFMPEHQSEQARAAKLGRPVTMSYDYPSAALVTFDLLKRMKPESGYYSSVKMYQPWMSFMDQILSGVTDAAPPSALAQKVETTDNPNYFKGVISRLVLRSDAGATAGLDISSTTERAADLSMSEEGGPSTRNEPRDKKPQLPNKLGTAYDPATPALRFTGNCEKRMGRAIEQQDLAHAHDIYRDVKEFLTRRPDTVLPQALYEDLLYMFLSLRSPNPTISIWNDMVKAGHRPTVKTYTIMMRGSQDIRDQSMAMEKFWQKMRQSGLQPDHNAWTTRIFGMLKSRLSSDVALKALDEMGQDWEVAARAELATQTPSKGRNKEKKIETVPIQTLLAKFPGDVNGVPKPDVAVMNSAVSGLANREDHLIPNVLSWGRRYGIQLDLITYNVLINISMRKGLPDEALKMLRRMSDEGIEPDSTTWTVLLSAMFEGNSLTDLSAEEVEQRVLDFVRSIDEMPGPGLDVKGYALIVDRLFKKYDNTTGAQRILEHMATKGIELNTHIYNILMTSYFQKSPPDFAAVEALWAQIESGNDGHGIPMDALFYDRMIEAYAQHHNTVGTQRMLNFLERMEAQGKRPSWKALEFAARALAEAGQTSRLMQIAQRASQERRGPVDRKNFGEQEFWRFLDSVGIRRDDYQRSSMSQLR